MFLALWIAVVVLWIWVVALTGFLSVALSRLEEEKSLRRILTEQTDSRLATLTDYIHRCHCDAVKGDKELSDRVEWLETMMAKSAASFGTSADRIASLENRLEATELRLERNGSDLEALRKQMEKLRFDESQRVWSKLQELEAWLNRPNDTKIEDPRFEELIETVDRLTKVDLQPLNREFRDRIDRLSGVMSDHKNEMKGHVGVLRDHVEVCKEKIEDLKHVQDAGIACSEIPAARLASIAKNLDYLSDRVVALESGGIVFGPPITNSPVRRGVEVAKGTCSHTSEQDWEKLKWKDLDFTGFSTDDRFFSKMASRLDELQPKATSAGDDLRAAEVLPGSPAAKVGSQANHSSDLLRMFNAPPIICARGAMLVERKGV